MKIDLGVDPGWTRVGLLILGTGLVLEIYLFTHTQTVNVGFAILIGCYFAVGSYILSYEIGKTRRIRRQAREWASSQPEPEDEELLYGEPEPEQQVVRYKRNGRGERRAIRAARRMPPEDNPHWPTYAARWVDKPENPTDEPGEGRTQ